ncbi:hypothetical protein BH09VER1_BH09VER1_21280 [soil metagenome]
MHWLVLLVIATSGFLQSAVAEGEPTEAQLDKLVQVAPKIHLPQLIAYNEAKLERIYQAKLASANPEYREALKNAQQAWRKYYEDDLVVGALDTQGGSGQAVFAMERRLYQLRLRIYQLSTDFLQGWVEIPRVKKAGAK